MRATYFLFCYFIIPALLASVAASAQELPPADALRHNLVVSVNRVSKEGQSFYALHASGMVRAAPQKTWKVLTSYGEMHDFVPNLTSATLLSRSAQESVIEQKWTRSVLFFSRDITLVVRAVETPISSIDITLISGEMKQYQAHWQLTPITAAGTTAISGTRISYEGKIEPDAFLPSFIGTSIMLSDLKKMMAAVLAEIDK